MKAAFLVLFLDVDGVLNSDRFLNKDRVSEKDADWMQWWLDYFDPAGVEVLNGLLEASGAKIVLSSTRRWWASMDDLTEILRRAGVRGELVGRTPYLQGRTRGEEIQKWLDENEGEVPDSFVILDDHDDMSHLADRLVRVDSKVGLTAEDAERALRALGPPAPAGQGRPRRGL